MGPFKEATEEIRDTSYVTFSLAIPITNLIHQAVEYISPSTGLVQIVKEALLKQVQKRLGPLEKNSYLSAATILDLHFKTIHLPSSNAVSRISRKNLQ